ncbi:ATP-binding protein [Sinosporangium siamense]|uniref:LuxR family transcriptional regulator n=1 Tax=Sinosporangium siamense TaxID=1367973 RepID=A0A919RD63_9ACTN|nr:LuxR C-terminal-related transcriptional regulator [Sinosporangium siamense]GII90284.1 LuxR family transcriptional regulator [Sinosporangium siamense]
MGLNRRGDLPVELTPFVGRRSEVASVRRMLQRSRLVTVTGIPGVGKSRIALRAAHSLRRAFTGGVHLVELSSLTDPRRLERVVAHALGVPDRPTRPAAEVLADYLADRELLLVLDTCEHLIDACAHMAQTLLAATPGLRVLATSRQVLGAPGEHSLVVHPMAVPPADPTGSADPRAALAECDSARLFLDRVAAVDPGFTLTDENAAAVAELCRRLDGIPLAIELAAVRARALPVSRILQLIRERPAMGQGTFATADARHQTMWAAIAWSHDLCTPEERLLWARLSVFSGGFDLAAATAVCADADLPASRVFPALDGLVEKSIVVCTKQDGRTRYHVLDSIREYGKAQMDDPAEAQALATRHRDHYLAEAEAASARLGPRGDQVARWARMRADWPNLRAALEFCVVRPGEAATGLRLVTQLWFLWIACGMPREGRHYLETLLALGAGHPRDRAHALLRLAYLTIGQGDFPAAKSALAECARLNVPEERFHLLKLQGTLAFGEGDMDAAERCLAEAERHLDDAGDVRTVKLAAMVEMGLTRVWARRIDDAAEVLERCRAVSEAGGESWSRSWADIGLTLVCQARGDTAAAAFHAREALKVAHPLHDVVAEALSMELMAWLAADGVPERAVRLLSAAYQRWTSVGRYLFGSPQLTAEHQRFKERLVGSLSPAAYKEGMTAGRTMSTDDIVAYALGPADTPATAVNPSPWAPLSPREREVAELVADGLTNRQIAQRLVVARRTVDTHVEHILAKLGYAGRAQIAAWAANRRAEEHRTSDP